MLSIRLKALTRPTTQTIVSARSAASPGSTSQPRPVLQSTIAAHIRRQRAAMPPARPGRRGSPAPKARMCRRRSARVARTPLRAARQPRGNRRAQRPRRGRASGVRGPCSRQACRGSRSGRRPRSPPEWRRSRAQREDERGDEPGFVRQAGPPRMVADARSDHALWASASGALWDSITSLSISSRVRVGRHPSSSAIFAVSGMRRRMSSKPAS